MDGYRPGWTLLGGQMHIPDADRPGYARCGRLIGSNATIQLHRSGFDACPQCVNAPVPAPPRTASSRLRRPASPAREPQKASPAHTPEQLAQFRRDREDLARARRLGGARRTAPGAPITSSAWTALAGSWSVPIGWVVLAGTPVVHRPCPDRPGHVMCGRELVDEPVYRRRPPLPTCRHCTLARQQALAAERAVAREEGRTQPSQRKRASARPRPRMVSGGLPTLGSRRR